MFLRSPIIVYRMDAPGGRLVRILVSWRGNIERAGPGRSWRESIRGSCFPSQWGQPHKITQSPLDEAVKLPGHLLAAHQRGHLLEPCSRDRVYRPIVNLRLRSWSNWDTRSMGMHSCGSASGVDDILSKHSREADPMRSSVQVLATIALLVLVCGASGVHAGDIIVSNLGEPHTLWDTIRPFVPGVQDGFEAAQAFKTGPNDYELAKILANLGNLDPGSNFTLTATLNADDGGKPGSFLTGFSYSINSIPGSGFANIEFDRNNLITLTSTAPPTGSSSTVRPLRAAPIGLSLTRPALPDQVHCPFSTRATMEDLPGMARSHPLRAPAVSSQ